MSFTIVQRTRELGIRAALGAGRNSIVLLVAGRAFAQLGLGVLLGTPIAGRLLFELRGAGRASVEFPIVVTLFVGLGVMILIATLGCTVPTLRALRIMPTEALKCGG
jgi:ABC-type antimicrobial peptide transport system permease subunit